MTFGHISPVIDLPQVLFWLFFLGFLALVWYLRRADKLEGYPMKASPFDPSPLAGFPLPPEKPHRYLLNEGGTSLAPHRYAPGDMHARPLYLFDGTPLTPVGNPLLAGLGPGAWVKRRDEPMLTEKGELNLQPLRLLPDWSVPHGEADPRGMRVFDLRWNEVGVVRDVWVDRSIKIIRLLEIELRPGLGRPVVLAPIFHATVGERTREIRIESLYAQQFADVPMPASADRITAQEDERLNAYYAAGRFYRDDPLTHPPCPFTCLSAGPAFMNGGNGRSGHSSGVLSLMPGERVLWQGRPGWRAVARDVLHVRLVALYLGVVLVWGVADDRALGLGPAQAVGAALPSLVLGLAVLGALAAFAWGCARTTRYTVTTERCIVEYGIALEATLSVPLRRVAAVSLALSRDGTGSVPLTLKPGQAVSALKLWPHVRLPRRGFGLGRAEPMLRGVPDAAHVGELVAHAVRAVSPGRLAPLPDPAGDAPLVTAPAAGS